MVTFITVVHVSCCFLLILLVLLQSGKGAEISASFGGSSQTVFGSSGGANFFTRLTASMATIFMITSITLTLMGSQAQKSIMEGAVQKTKPAPIEAAPTPPPAPPAEPGAKAPPAKAPGKTAPGK